MLIILNERRRKFPRKTPNSRSVFRSNSELYDKFGPPGKIIENLGCKNMRVGGIVVSEKHADFFVNDQNGTSKDFRQRVSRVNQLPKTNGINMKTEKNILS
jgi:UDP-N-acetylmuramate dehydrogenase